MENNKLLRKDPDGPITGVATGLATYLKVEPIWIQLGFLVGVLLAGAGLFAYAAAWLIMPNQDSKLQKAVTVTDDSKRLVVGLLIAFLGIAILADVLSVELTYVAAIALIAGSLILLFRTREDLNNSTNVVQQSVTKQPETVSESLVPVQAAVAVQNDPIEQHNVTDSDHWANIKVEEVKPKKIYPPITAVTIGLASLVFGVCFLARELGASIGFLGIVGFVIATLGLGTLVAAVWGRPGKLVVLGFLSLFLLPVADLIELGIEGGYGYRPVTTSSQSALKEKYELGAGELEMDLSNLELTSDTRFEIDMGAGYALVILPKDLPVSINASSTFGDLEILGTDREGIENEVQVNKLTNSSNPTLTIDAHITYGMIEIIREGDEQSFEIFEDQEYKQWKIEQFDRDNFDPIDSIDAIDPIRPIENGAPR